MEFQVCSHIIRKKDMNRDKKIALVTLTIVAMLLLLAIGAYSIYTSAQNRKELLFDKSTIALNEAITIERKQYTDIKFIHYNALLSSDSLTAQEQQEWVEQEILVQNDPHRYRLDSLFQVELAEQGVHIWTGIRCNRNGKETNSQPEEEFQQASLLKTIEFHSKKGDIILQAFIKIPNRMLIYWEHVYILIGIALLGIGILVLLIFRKEYLQPASLKDLQPANSDVQVPVTSENVQLEQLTPSIQYDRNQSVVIHNGLKTTLKGNMAVYFEILLRAENHKVTYKHILIALQQQYKIKDGKVSIEDRNTISHAIKQLDRQLALMDIQIKNIWGKGYQMIFPDEREE